MIVTLLNDKQLVVTKNTPIYRGDNMNTSIIFLLPIYVDNVNLETATVFLSYIRADGEPDMVILEKAEAKYNNSYYQYTLPVTCKLSRYPGQVCMWLQICDGNSDHPIIAKSGECTINIHKSKSLDDVICDHQLTAMYQLQKKLEKAESEKDDCEWEDMVNQETPSCDCDVWEDM